jgi:hypothetical protein
MPREPHAFRREAIEVRRRDAFLSEATDFAPTEVVRDDQDHIPAMGRGLAVRRADRVRKVHGKRCGQKDKERFHDACISLVDAPSDGGRYAPAPVCRTQRASLVGAGE